MPRVDLKIAVAVRLLECGKVNFANLSLRVIKPPQQFDENKTQKDIQDDDVAEENKSDYEDALAGSTVIVSNVQKSMTKDFLFMFFENSRRSGGGKINDVLIDRTTATAHVTFANPQGDEHFWTYAKSGIIVNCG